MMKTTIATIRRKNEIINNIISAMAQRNEFLLCGHKNPDEDCIASMVAFAILLTKFDKPVSIYLSGPVPGNIDYLISICRYNGIGIIGKGGRVPSTVDTIVTCDTPKGAMLDISKKIETLMRNKNIIKIEIDHHLGADSDYIGDPDYRFVTEASSASELVGILALKLRNKKDVLSRFMISDPFSRNFVLAILTGIIGDTGMGKYLKTRREKRLYGIFSRIYDDILMTSTVKETNITRMEEIYNELRQQSQREEECYNYIFAKRKESKAIASIVLTEEDMDYLYRTFDAEVITTVTKSIANDLAEITRLVGLIVFYDEPGTSGLVQFRMRRSQDYKAYDLRNVLTIFSIENGGGHEGAIGFRFPKGTVPDLQHYVDALIARVESEILGAAKTGESAASS